MFNIIKFENYRLFRNKLFYIMIGIIAFFSTIITIDNVYSKYEGNTNILEVIHYIFLESNILLVISTITTIVLINLDYKNSFIKNIYPNIKNKYLYWLQK